MPRPAATIVRALAVAAALAATGARAAGPAVEEDAGRAFATARDRGALVLVDVWAPW